MGFNRNTIICTKVLPTDLTPFYKVWSCLNNYTLKSLTYWGWSKMGYQWQTTFKMDFLHKENFIEMGPNIVFANVSHVKNEIPWNTFVYAPWVPIDFTAFYKVSQWTGILQSLWEHNAIMLSKSYSIVKAISHCCQPSDNGSWLMSLCVRNEAIKRYE